MTASQMTAPAISEDQPAPVVEAEGGAPAGPAAGDGTTADGKGQKRKLVLLLLLLAMFALLLGTAVWYLLFRQPVPLPPIPVTQVPHYTNAYYNVNRPTGVAASPSGDRIYVTQSGGDRVALVLDGSGNKVTEMLPPLSSGQSHAPVYIAVDPVNGEVYVSDRPTGSIFIFDANGAYLRKYLPTVERKGWQPMGLTFDKDGNLYVTDLGAAPAQVVKFDRSANVLATFGASDNMDFPNGVAVDPAGYVYVTDSNNGRLMVYAPDGTLAASVGRGAGSGQLGLPRGIVADTQGRVYVMDTSGQSGYVYKQFQAGQSRLEFVGTFGSQGVANGQFMYPTGLAIDAKGKLYVADTSNDRIQLWNY